jgi:hypothetical protein
MMIPKSKSISIILLIAVLSSAIAFCGTAQALDDGARAYWKTMENTNFLSFQYLPLNVDTKGQMFDPSLGIYPNAETDMDFYILSYGRQIALFDRSAMVMGVIYGGDITSEFHFLGNPLDPTSSTAFRSTVNGFGDPSVGLTVNLYGAPNIANFYDMANYEPKLTVDVSTLLTAPIGEYDNDNAINIGQNRWWGRIGFPVVAYFGSYAPLYRTSLEITPSLFIFGKNDDYLGQEMENDPIFQLEAHLTRDITRTLFGSIDFIHRQGFAMEIDGASAADDLELSTLGFTFDYMINDNAGIRFSYHSNFIDDDELDSDMLRIQFNYGWNALVENVKQLEHH